VMRERLARLMQEGHEGKAVGQRQVSSVRLTRSRAGWDRRTAGQRFNFNGAIPAGPDLRCRRPTAG
jgi:hypothetical protein